MSGVAALGDVVGNINDCDTWKASCLGRRTSENVPSVPGFQPAMKGQGAEVSEQSKVLGSALAVVLLSSPAAVYGFFYLASLVVGRSGDNWFSRQAALREVILTSWFITSMFGVYLGVASIAVYIMHLRKNSPVWVKVVTTTLLLFSIIGVLVVVLQIQRFGH